MRDHFDGIIPIFHNLEGTSLLHCNNVAMPQNLVLSLLLITLAACTPTGLVDQSPAAGSLKLGFNPAELDLSTRPQDDFYDYVNGIWIASTDIPPERTSYGTMTILFEETEHQVRDLIEQADDREQRKIRDLYASFMNEPLVEELGTAPLAGELDRIAALESHSDVTNYMALALTMGIQVPLDFYIDANAEDTNQSLAYFWQSGLGLPDRDYYLTDNERLADVREHYAAHITRMFELAGWQGGAEASAAITRIEHRIAESHWSRVQNRNRELIYRSKFSLSSASDLSDQFDWAPFLEKAGFGRPDEFIIAQTDYFAELGKIIREYPVEQWRDYLRFKTLKAHAPYLNEALLQEDFDFQGRILRGQKEIQPRWKRGVRLVNLALGEAVGKAYVTAHFSTDSKERVNRMIENLRAAFGEAIDELEWMSIETKVKARQKLALFTSKIGYPGKWRDYSTLTIAADDLVGNVRRARAFEHYRQVAKLYKPVDRTEWGMTPQTVNAYYRPTMNEIVFPAAILQPPFFDPEADDAINYGAIGSVIGHEFSHGFDDQGRKFSGEGRLTDWWAESDAAEYIARSRILIEQYDRFNPLPDQAINGELTLGENIADLAGLVIAYRAWQMALDRKDSPVIEGFSGDERFFIGYALGWRGKFRDEYLREILLSDPHAPYRYRVIGALQNMQAFYDTYDLQPGDGMYLAPDKRVKIW